MFFSRCSIFSTIFRIKCPLCKVETVLQNANALPTNFQLLGEIPILYCQPQSISQALPTKFFIPKWQLLRISLVKCVRKWVFEYSRILGSYYSVRKLWHFQKFSSDEVYECRKKDCNMVNRKTKQNTKYHNFTVQTTYLPQVRNSRSTRWTCCELWWEDGGGMNIVNFKQTILTWVLSVNVKFLAN